MNSNKFPTLFRETFGTKDSYGKLYGDILTAFLHLQRISKQELDSGFISSPQKNKRESYKIHTDFKTYKRISEQGEAACIISFQKRIDGNFAMVRLYKEIEK